MRDLDRDRRRASSSSRMRMAFFTAMPRMRASVVADSTGRRRQQIDGRRGMRVLAPAGDAAPGVEPGALHRVEQVEAIGRLALDAPAGTPAASRPCSQACSDRSAAAPVSGTGSRRSRRLRQKRTSADAHRPAASRRSRPSPGSPARRRSAAAGTPAAAPAAPRPAGPRPPDRNPARRSTGAG